jgi:hypothetical protein
VRDAGARSASGTGLAALPASAWTTSLGCFLLDMVTPYPAPDMPLARTLRGEVVSNAEIFVVNPAAPQRTWLSVNGTAVRDARGRIEGGVVVLRDVSPGT